MAISSRKKNNSPSSSPRRVRLDSRWWLPLSVALSLLLHIVLGISGARLLSPPRRDMAVADEGGGVDITLAPGRKPQERKPGGAVSMDEQAPRLVSTPAPARPVASRPAPQATYTPLPNAPDVVQPAPKDPRRVAEIPAPEREPVTAPTPIVPQPETPDIPRTVATPVPIPSPARIATANPKTFTPKAQAVTPEPEPSVEIVPVPTARPVPPMVVRPNGGKIPDRLETPLPKGLETGSTEITARVFTPRDMVRQPNIRTTIDEGAGGSGRGLPNPDANAQPDAPLAGVGGGVVGGAGGGDLGGKGAGVGAGAGAGAGLGITRGIPFGDRLGIDLGDPRGGGGRGGGIGGSSPAGSSGVGFSRETGFRLPRATGGGPPVSIVYVVDVSGSMEEGNKIGKARAALIKALGELRPEDSFNIVAFSDRAKLLTPRTLKATNANISVGTVAVNVLQAQGATNISAAFDIALKQADITHIFFLSDGEPTEGITEYGQLLAMIRERNTSRARIITLALGRGERFRGIELLRRMAEENNGRYDYIDLSK